MKDSRITTDDEFSDYSDMYKDVYGFRPRSRVTKAEADKFFKHCYQEAKPVTLEDGTVRMISEPQPWLAKQWAEG